MSRRKETAYKTIPGELAQHNEALGSEDMVNAEVVLRKFTSLSGEACPSCGQDSDSARCGNLSGDRAGVSRGHGSRRRNEP